MSPVCRQVSSGVEGGPAASRPPRRLRDVAGRIREEDIAEVRERARIDDVVSAYVTLRPGGGGSYKGLCPFHDEKSPSFHVTPARQFWHCFGCGEGGDVFNFLMKIDGLTFVEAVERLAEKHGVQLRREEGDERPERSKGPQRSRLIDAHRVAQEFYADRLGTPTRSSPGSSSTTAASTRRRRSGSGSASPPVTARRCSSTCVRRASRTTR